MFFQDTSSEEIDPVHTQDKLRNDKNWMQHYSSAEIAYMGKPMGHINYAASPQASSSSESYYSDEEAPADEIKPEQYDSELDSELYTYTYDTETKPSESSQYETETDDYAETDTEPEPEPQPSTEVSDLVDFSEVTESFDSERSYSVDNIQRERRYIRRSVYKPKHVPTRHEKVECEVCGSIVRRDGLSIHRKTQKHQTFARANSKLLKLMKGK